MINAKQELLKHIGDSTVKYVQIDLDYGKKHIEGTLEQVLPQLDFDYHSGYGSQELFGTIWYMDGTWSEREEYDGSEWWQHFSRPDCPLDEAHA